MPRGPRLDAPGTLHHVIARGIERKEIFKDKVDYQDFLQRLELVVDQCNLEIYAWALIPNHFHLLIRTKDTPLSKAMRKLMTGYAVNFNRRHQRNGYLFQNRYKSILCEDEPYLMELVRYVHLNPYRAGIAKSLEELDRYNWSGHLALIGRIERKWQNTEEILLRFSEYKNKAIINYRKFIEEGKEQGRRTEFTGGGLKRSAGGWFEVLALKRQKCEMASDARILGRGEFVEEILKEAEKKELETLRLKRKKIGIKELCEKVIKFYKIEMSELTSGNCRETIIKARRETSHIAVKKLGLSGAEVARYLGVTASCINRIAGKGEISREGEIILRSLDI
ncbi:transposase [Candidatus Desantisbacteria bacterium]|nr:transposase [Candidatus Desantisbacteria bacterium]